MRRLIDTVKNGSNPVRKNQPRVFSRDKSAQASPLNGTMSPILGWMADERWVKSRFVRRLSRLEISRALVSGETPEDFSVFSTGHGIAATCTLMF